MKKKIRLERTKVEYTEVEIEMPEITQPPSSEYGDGEEYEKWYVRLYEDVFDLAIKATPNWKTKTVSPINMEMASYDKNFGYDKICICTHPYNRHFDSYDHMKPVGCKYCVCSYFIEAENERPTKN